MAAPRFVTIDAQQIFDDRKADYESRVQTQTGDVNFTLEPGDPMYLVLWTETYREVLLLQSIQSAGEQGLVTYSIAPVLDELARNRNVTRLEASPAVCTIQLNFVAGHNTLTVPQGTRIASTDGQAVFATDQDVLVDVGVNTVTVNATCQTAGIIGNAYAIGAVAQIMDPQPYLQSASNIDKTSGGSDRETDDALRQRIILANATYSVAGSPDAYKYFALTANPAIIDVYVTSLYPGEDDIFILTNSLNTTSQAVLDQVAAVLNDDAIRQLCNVQNIVSATRIDYDLNVGVYLYRGVASAPVITDIRNALLSYTDALSRTMNNDIIVDHLKDEAMVDKTKIYEFDFNGLTDIIVPQGSFAVCNSITVTLLGFKDK